MSLKSALLPILELDQNPVLTQKGGDYTPTQDYCLCHFSNFSPFYASKSQTSVDDKISDFTSDEFLKEFDVRTFEKVQSLSTDCIPTFDDFQDAWNSRYFDRQRGDTVKDDLYRMNLILNSFDSRIVLDEMSDDSASTGDYDVDLSPDTVSKLLLVESIDDLQDLKFDTDPVSVKLDSLIVREFSSPEFFEDNDPASDSNDSYFNDTENGITLTKETNSFETATFTLDEVFNLEDHSQVLNSMSFETLLLESEKSDSKSPDRTPLKKLKKT